MSAKTLAASVALVLSAMGAGSAGDARGAVVTEYFNNYGTAQVNVSSLNGGAGWSAAWTGSTDPDYGPLGVNAAFGLSYTAPGYSNAGNETGNEDGGAIFGGGTAGSVVSRSLQVGAVADTGLTGTIWISALYTNGSSGTSSDGLLWIDRPDTTNTYVAIRDGAGKLRYNGGTDLNATGPYGVESSTYLYLVKVVINASGTNDTVDFWINPDLSNGEAGLGSPTLSGANNANAFGNAFSGIGLSFEGTAKIDAIRISNEATGFTDVTSVVAVPEPTAIGLLALTGMAMARRRTRRA